MGINLPDDDDSWCPRLRWCVENAEDLGWLRDLWVRYREQKKILEFIAIKPRARQEILQEFGITSSRWRSFMNEFGHRGVKIKSKDRWKSIIYELESKPEDYKFSQKTNYHHL